MSKLIDMMNSSSKGQATNVGFKKIEEIKKMFSVQAIVNLTGRTEAEKRELISSGIATAVMDCGTSNSAALTKYLKNGNEVIKGLIVDDKKIATELAGEKTTIDFIILNAKLPATTLYDSQLENAGKILKVELSCEIGMLRAVSAFSIEAVIIDLHDSEYLLEDMLNCRKIADFTGLPMIAAIGRLLTSAELICLRDTGFKGILMGVNIGVADVKTMLETIKTLPVPVRKKEKGNVAILPRLINPAAAEESDGDGDGDDD